MTKVKLIPFEEIHSDLMSRPGYRKAYRDLQPEFELIKAIIIARTKHGLTQRQLADRIGIPQSSLARFESGKVQPTMRFYKKVVHGLGMRIAIL
jgi:DNA-binding XRE family transcriptional regulator